jgi:AcrR family transcriptional regulator
MPRAVRRAQLMEIAEAIVLEGGVSALSMSRVGAEAGVARTVVYSSFENTSALLLAVVQRHWARLDEQFVHVVSIRPFEAQLRAYAEVYLGGSAGERLKLRRLLDAALHEPAVNAVYQQRQQVRREGWSRRIRADLGLSPAAAGFTALAVLETLHALGDVVYEDDQKRRAAVDMFVSGMLGLARSLA